MRAMILAAGRGERMGAMTLNTPKPLLSVGGKYLIEYAIESLKTAGISEIVINIFYHAQQIKDRLGNGQRYGVNIFYSEEKDRLETGGGIFNALSLLGDDPFIVMSSDIITDYQLKQLPREPNGLAHLLLVNNPVYHAKGDFGLGNQSLLDLNAQPTLTFASVGVYRKELFKHCQPGYFRLSELLIPAIKNQQITGEKYSGLWLNIGTSNDLAAANLLLQKHS